MPAVERGSSTSAVEFHLSPQRAGLCVFMNRQCLGTIFVEQGLPSEAITVAIWVFVKEHREFSRFVTNNWISNGWILMADGQSRARFGVGVSNREYVSSAPLTARRWHYICGDNLYSFLSLRTAFLKN